MGRRGIVRAFLLCSLPLRFKFAHDWHGGSSLAKDASKAAASCRTPKRLRRKRKRTRPIPQESAASSASRKQAAAPGIRFYFEEETKARGSRLAGGDRVPQRATTAAARQLPTTLMAVRD